MPAAAVIPAPIAYIKVVAVKKLVVGFQFSLWGPLKKGLSSVVQVVRHYLTVLPSSGHLAFLVVTTIWFEQNRARFVFRCS